MEESTVIGVFQYGGFKVMLECSPDETAYWVSSSECKGWPQHVDKYDTLGAAREWFEEKVADCISRTSLSMVSLSMQHGGIK